MIVNLSNIMNHEFFVYGVWCVFPPFNGSFMQLFLLSSKTVKIKITNLIETVSDDWRTEVPTIYYSVSTPDACMNSNFFCLVKLTCTMCENLLTHLGKHTTFQGHQNTKRGDNLDTLVLLARNSNFSLLKWLYFFIALSRMKIIHIHPHSLDTQQTQSEKGIEDREINDVIHDSLWL